jgi:hypothetical protein
MILRAYIEDLLDSSNVLAIKGGELLLLGFCKLCLACLAHKERSLSPLRVVLRHRHPNEEVLGIRHIKPIKGLEPFLMLSCSLSFSI